MNGKVLPPNFLSGSLLDNIFHAPYTVQFFHRFIGTLLLGVACYLIFINMKINSGSLMKSAEIQFSFSILLQFILGVSTLLLKVPIHLALAHQILACFVAMLCVKMLYIASSR